MTTTSSTQLEFSSRAGYRHALGTFYQRPDGWPRQWYDLQAAHSASSEVRCDVI
ncbi:hypothetical protein VQ574_04180 [Stutzerimonas frequens]|uniref:hypothetical protein n=1 Tax=Stutzerimonas frequens TaxID=2968969 RepID=UPI002DBD5450|nr:hypothetical protein [Stutzerimonas frequens]WRW27941.1 hypothetical protein VQ574_04180 [Stutzerimonas frequens]